jgi:hypothetical protein
MLMAKSFYRRACGEYQILRSFKACEAKLGSEKGKFVPAIGSEVLGFCKPFEERLRTIALLVTAQSLAKRRRMRAVLCYFVLCG